MLDLLEGAGAGASLEEGMMEVLRVVGTAACDEVGTETIGIELVVSMTDSVLEAPGGPCLPVHLDQLRPVLDAVTVIVAVSITTSVTRYRLTSTTGEARAATPIVRAIVVDNFMLVV